MHAQDKQTVFARCLPAGNDPLASSKPAHGRLSLPGAPWLRLSAVLTRTRRLLTCSRRTWACRAAMLQWCCQCCSVVQCASRWPLRGILGSCLRLLCSETASWNSAAPPRISHFLLVSSFTLSVNGCRVPDGSTLGPNVPTCQKRDQALNPLVFGDLKPTVSRCLFPRRAASEQALQHPEVFFKPRSAFFATALVFSVLTGHGHFQRRNFVA